MNPQWGRTDAAGAWPNPKPIWTMATVMIAVVSALAIGVVRYATVWTPLQRLYLGPYLRSAILANIGVAGRADYRLLQVVDRTGSRLALEDEVMSVRTASGEVSWALTEPAVRAGDLRLVWHDARHVHRQFHAFLRRWIYRNQGLVDLVTPAIEGALGVLLVGLIIALPQDAARRRARREGRRLKGPELVTVAQLNDRTRGDGIGFFQVPSLGDRLLRRRPSVRIPRGLESSHFLILGDSGTGKSVLIRQLLQQLEARGDTAIVYDPATEYTPSSTRPPAAI